MLDHDFVDVLTMDANPQDTLETEEEPAEEEPALARRGKDVEWEELVHFENNQQFQGSDVKAEIDEFMTKRKEWKTVWATNQNYCCKFQNKAGYKSCPRQFKVCLISTCHKIYNPTNVVCLLSY